MTNTNILHPPDDLIAVVDARQLPRPRVFRVTWRERGVWVKRAVANKRKSWHLLQRLIAAVTRLPILRPTVCIGGATGLRGEASRLTTLRGRGVAVPEVLGLTDGWLAIGELGSPLQGRLNDEPDSAQKGQLLALAAEALSQLHAKGEWHGSGALRDMTVTDQKIGFIDFEEDLNGVMPLAAAQARDVLLLLLSATQYAVAGDNPLPGMLAVYAVGAPKDVINELARLIPLARATHAMLRPFSRRLGRDARQGLIVAVTLETEIPKLLDA